MSEQGINRGQEMDTFNNFRYPFQQMHQIMRSYGGMGGFGEDFFDHDLVRDPFNHMMDFSSAHKKLHGANKQGSYVCQTFVSSSTRDKDGRLKEQTYFENSAGQNRNGHTISQKHQAYKNNDGLRRIAEERMLDDRGRKFVKEKRGDQEQEMSNHFYNMEEAQLDNFNRDWDGIDKETKFLENATKALDKMPYNQNGEVRKLNYQPRSHGRKQQARLPFEHRQDNLLQPDKKSTVTKGSHASSNSHRSNFRSH